LRPSGSAPRPFRPLITLLTDFGTRDPYVAAMKGVILAVNPEAELVDLSHEVPPQDIAAGAFFLAAAVPYFPTGTIHLAVVDPGVGTARRGLAAKAGGHFLVGPDNGLFHLVFRETSALTVVSLENPAYFRPEVSPTFHGRDIFAPVAAHLSLGVPLPELGPPLREPVRLPFPEPVFSDTRVEGQIVAVDRFGNLVSNIPWEALKHWLTGRPFRLHLGSLVLTNLSRTYADAAPGEALALVGSHGYLEIACNQASAAGSLGLGVGAAVTIRCD